MNASKIYTIADIKKRISPVAKKYGVKRMYLFGSYARGEAKPTSDIDLRIDGNLGFGYFKYFAMTDDFQERFNIPLDVITTDALDDDFLQEIEKEEVLVYGS